MTKVERIHHAVAAGGKSGQHWPVRITFEGARLGERCRRLVKNRKFEAKLPMGPQNEAFYRDVRCKVDVDDIDGAGIDTAYGQWMEAVEEKLGTVCGHSGTEANAFSGRAGKLRYEMAGTREDTRRERKSSCVSRAWARLRNWCSTVGFSASPVNISRAVQAIREHQHEVPQWGKVREEDRQEWRCFELLLNFVRENAGCKCWPGWP